MKPGRVWFLTAAVVALTACASSTAASDDNLNEQLKTRYANQVLMLRHFYKGDHLSFQADGTLLGTADVGPWTVDGRVLVKNIELKGNVLQIQGRRIHLFSDDKTKAFRDVLDYLEEASKVPVKQRKKDRDKNAQSTPQWEDLKNHYLNQSVEIDIALVGDNPGVQEISAGLTTVFVKPTESQADIVPDFWRDYFDKAEGTPTRPPQSTDAIYRVEPGKVLPPRATYAPEPEFSEYAMPVKFQGTVTCGVVVDVLGRPTEIRIISPIGLGLDEKAVEAISKWKFEPAKKSGKPVSVAIAIEVDFHLN